MATFTMTLAEALDFSTDIGLDEYPIFDPTYRAVLNKKIQDEFLNQEIGQETLSMFRHAMKREMNKIMPLYNQMYKSQMIAFDPLSTVNIESITDNIVTTETAANGTAVGSSTVDSDMTNNATVNGSSNAETNSTSDAVSRAVASAFPQQTLKPNGDYAKSAQDNTSKNTNNTNVDETNTNTTIGSNTADVKEDTTNTTTDTVNASQDGKTTSTVKGYQGVASELLMKLRESFLNIDRLIIEEIERDGLFMLVYASGESFTERNRRYGYYLPNH